MPQCDPTELPATERIFFMWGKEKEKFSTHNIKKAELVLAKLQPLKVTCGEETELPKEEKNKYEKIVIFFALYPFLREKVEEIKKRQPQAEVIIISPDTVQSWIYVKDLGIADIVAGGGTGRIASRIKNPLGYKKLFKLMTTLNLDDKNF